MLILDFLNNTKCQRKTEHIYANLLKIIRGKLSTHNCDEKYVFMLSLGGELSM